MRVRLESSTDGCSLSVLARYASPLFQGGTMQNQIFMFSVRFDRSSRQNGNAGTLGQQAR